MKWLAVIVLVAIAIGNFVPPSLPLWSDQGARASIGTLDVCHGAIPALSAVDDMPGLGECSCILAPLLLTEFSTDTDLPFMVSPIPLQDERPPKA